MTHPEIEKDTYIQTLEADDTYTMITPDGEDDVEGDWNDEDDEVFDDLADDENSLHDAEVENGILDEGDDDHLPDEDDL